MYYYVMIKTDITPKKGILKKREFFATAPKKEESQIEIPHFKIADTQRLRDNFGQQKSNKSTSSQHKSWRGNALKIICLVSRFSRQLRMSANKVKFKLLNLRILDIIHDQSSDSQNLLLLRDNQFKRKRHPKWEIGQFLNLLPNIEPDSWYKLCWDIIILFSTLITILVIPLELSFELNFSQQQDAIFHTIPGILYCLDVFVTIMTSFYSKGVIHREKDVILHHYLTGRMALDMLVILPFFISQTGAYQLKYFLFLRIFRLQSMLETIEEMLNFQEVVANIIQLLKLVSFVIIVCHFCACMWAFIGQVQYQNGYESWIQYADGMIHAKWYVLYVTSFYFSTITTLTIGYGDIVPKTPIERLYVIVIALLVCGVLAYTISTIGNIFKQMTEKRDFFKAQMQILQRYMRARKLSQQLQLQVRKYFEHFIKIEQDSNSQAEKMMEFLTKNLKEQVNIDFYFQLLKKSRIIRENLCDKCIQNLCSFVHEQKFAPEDIIWNKGEVVTRLYILQRGELELSAGDKSISIIDKGVIGEREFAISGEYSATVTSSKFSQLAYINIEDFMKVIHEHQEDLEKFCMQKDNLLYNPNYKTFGSVCEICQWTHTLLKCPFVFSNANENKLAKEFKQSKDQLRLISDRSKLRYKCMNWLQDTQETALAFILQNQIMSQDELTDSHLQSLGFKLEQTFDQDNLTNSIQVRGSGEMKRSDSQTNKSYTHYSRAASGFQSDQQQQIQSSQSNQLQQPQFEKSQFYHNSLIQSPSRARKQSSASGSGTITHTKKNVQFNNLPELQPPQHKMTLVIGDQNSFLQAFNSQRILRMESIKSGNRIKSQQNNSIVSTVVTGTQQVQQRQPSFKRINPRILSTINMMAILEEENQKPQTTSTDFDIDKLQKMEIFFPIYNFDEVIKKVQSFQKEVIKQKIEIDAQQQIRKGMTLLNELKIMKQSSPFQQLGQSLVKSPNDDLMTLQLLNQFSQNSSLLSPRGGYEYLQTDRLAQQVQKQNEMILQLQQQLKEQEEPRNKRNRYPYQIPQYPLYPQQMPQMLPLPPPPVFLPPSYSFMQREELDREQKEKLQMLILMKRLRDENNELKQRLSGGLHESRSYATSSYRSDGDSRFPQRKQQARPKKGPTADDLEKEQDDLKQLLKQCLIANLQLCTRRYVIMMRFVKRVRSALKYNMELFVDGFPTTYLELTKSLDLYLADILKVTLDEFKLDKNVNFTIEQKNSQAEIKKRSDALKSYVKKITNAIVDNVDLMPQAYLPFMRYLTTNFMTTAPFFLMKFEINRLLYTPTGGTLMDQRKAQMMLLTVIWGRSVIPFLMKIYQPPPDNKVDKNAILLQSNVWNMSSLIYECMIDFLEGFVPAQPNNLKNVAVECQPTQRQGGMIKFQNYTEREKDKQKIEPMLYPMLDRTDFAVVWSDRQYIQMIQALLEGWSEAVYNKVDGYIKNEKVLSAQKYTAEELPKWKNVQPKQPTKLVLKVKEFRSQITQKKQIINEMNQGITQLQQQQLEKQTRTKRNLIIEEDLEIIDDEYISLL